MKISWATLMITLVFLITSCGGGGGSTSIDSKIKEGNKLATLGDAEVHEGFLKLLQQVNPNISGQMKNPAGKKRLVDNLLEQELLYREALKQGIDKKNKYKEKAALYERVIYAQGLVEEQIDVKAQDYYDKNKEKEFSQVKVSHILIRVPPKGRKAGKDGKPVSDKNALAKANEAKKKLDEGVSWEEVVEEYSDDRLTKKRGGDLGKISQNDRRAGRMEWQAMIEAAFKMKAGEISKPIKARDGYHIIKVIEEAAVAPFDEVANRIKFKLRGQVKRDVLAGLTKGKTTNYTDESLKSIGASPQTPPGLPGRLPAGAGPQIQIKKPEAKSPAAPKAPEKIPTPPEKKDS